MGDPQEEWSRKWEYHVYVRQCHSFQLRTGWATALYLITRFLFFQSSDFPKFFREESNVTLMPQKRPQNWREEWHGQRSVSLFEEQYSYNNSGQGSLSSPAGSQSEIQKREGPLHCCISTTVRLRVTVRSGNLPLDPWRSSVNTAVCAGT